MRAKIQKSMLLLICAAVISSFVMLEIVFYVYSLNQMKKEVKQEVEYIVAAIHISGTSYLDEMDAAAVDTRLTLISEEGEVLYDSQEDEYTFQNHAGREEIREAMENGSGEALRSSETVGKRTYYYAVRLEEGMVLRASKTLDYLIPIVLGALPFMVLTALIMIVLAYFLAKWQTARLIRPINELDLEHPLENSVYEELTPLLQNMESQNKAKEEVADMRKEFSANVSHELKTPLTSISGYAEIMKSGIAKPEDMTRFSEIIYKEASRLIVLIEDIMKLSKLDEQDVDMEREDVDLFDMCREICNRLAFQAEQKDVHLELTGEKVLYNGVRQILDEMIYNVCENAVKYNVDGGRVKIWVGNTLRGPKIIVEDTGIGIPEDQKERIFERFYRVDKSHSKATGGTGLGLSIVKHGAIYHHAEIHVESTLGKGTRMEIWF